VEITYWREGGVFLDWVAAGTSPEPTAGVEGDDIALTRLMTARADDETAEVQSSRRAGLE
jgi:hypothetical protein